MDLTMRAGGVSATAARQATPRSADWNSVATESAPGGVAWPSAGGAKGRNQRARRRAGATLFGMGMVLLPTGGWKKEVLGRKMYPEGGPADPTGGPDLAFRPG